MDASTRIFVRDDDVGALTPAFQAFFARFADAGIPVSYQVIPEKLTDDCAQFLRAEMARRPGLLELGQHGLRHEMIVRGKVEFYEFGPERSYAQQRDDVQAGRDLMLARLGPDVPLDVFTPPRHRYNRNTLKAVKAAGFSVLSSSSYTSAKHRLAYGLGRALGLTNLGRPGVPWHGKVRPDSGLFELSVAVGADNGGQVIASPDAVIAGLAEASRHTRDVGLMTHHQAYDTPEGQAYLDALIAGLKGLPASFHTIGALYAGPTGARTTISG